MQYALTGKLSLLELLLNTRQLNHTKLFGFPFILKVL